MVFTTDKINKSSHGSSDFYRTTRDKIRSQAVFKLVCSDKRSLNKVFFSAAEHVVCEEILVK